MSEAEKQFSLTRAATMNRRDGKTISYQFNQFHFQSGYKLVDHPQSLQISTPSRGYG
jgi:hypothetical protein